MTPGVSVVVPTCGRPAQLRRCLDALRTQSLPAPDYEIVVVDDERSDRTESSVRSLADRNGRGPRIRYVRPGGAARGPAAARNAGWRAATGAVIAFTDDDTIPAHDWLAQGRAAMRPGVSAAWGEVVVPLPILPTDSERNTAGLAGAEFVTANCFVRREVLAGGIAFDERFERPWREDSDIYFTLLERGLRVVRAPAAVVVHPPLRAPVTNCLRQHRNLFFDALLYKKHPRLYRQKIAAGPPLRYYAIVGSLGVCAVALLAHRPLFAAAAGAAWAALTAGLAMRRLAGLSRAPAQVAGIVATSLLIPWLAVYWRLAGAFRFRVPFA